MLSTFRQFLMVYSAQFAKCSEQQRLASFLGFDALSTQLMFDFANECGCFSVAKKELGDAQLFFELCILLSDDTSTETKRQLMSNLSCFHSELENYEAQGLY